MPLPHTHVRAYAYIYNKHWVDFGGKWQTHSIGAALITSSPLSHNGRYFADNTLKCMFVNEYFFILIRILLKFATKGEIDNKPALVQVMAWRRTGDKPLPEPMLTQINDVSMPN